MNISPNFPDALQAAQLRHLVSRLAEAEGDLHAFTKGGLDTCADSSGQTYLLRPAQQSLQRNGERLQAVIDSAPTVITVVNRAGDILSQSGAAQRALGYEADETVGLSIFDLVHAEDQNAVRFAFFGVIELYRETATTEFRHQTRNGSYQLVEATLTTLLHDPSTEVVFCLRPLAAARAASELPNPLFAAANEALVAKERFLAMLSHELRTPLMPVMLGLHELLSDDRFAAARPILAMIQNNLKLQTRLLDELTDYVSLGQKKTRLRLEAVNAHEAIHQTAEICRSESTAAHIAVTFDLQAEENHVLADSAKLQQILWNLLKNAIKFSTPGSSVSVTTSNDAPGFLTFSFLDHGLGIEAALLPLIFDSFQQGDALMPKPPGSLGLGLFIAKGLAEAQGGTLTVSSAGRGQGTTFRLKLRTTPASSGIPKSS